VTVGTPTDRFRTPRVAIAGEPLTARTDPATLTR
jgi:hypothetical protein